MFKKFISMATAAILFGTVLSVIAAAPASATNPDIDCSTIVSQQVVFLPMTGTSRDVVFAGNCFMFYGPLMATVPSGLTLTAVTNATIDSNGYASRTSPNTAWTVTVSGTPVSSGNPTSSSALMVLRSSLDVFSRVQFVTPAFYANANLRSLSIQGATLSPTFSESTYSYTASTSTSLSITASPVANRLGENSTKNALVSSGTCEGNSFTLTAGVSNGNYTGSCSVTSGSNRVISLTVTALDGTTTQTYTITVTASSGGGGGGGGGNSPAVISSTSTITAGQVNPSIVIQTSTGNFMGGNALNADSFAYLVNTGTTGLTRGTATISNGRLTVPFSGTASAGTLTFRVQDQVLGPFGASNILSFVVAGGSTPSPTLTAAEIAAAAAAAARAAEAAAAAIRAAEIATAQNALATVLRASKAGTLSEYRAANVNISTDAALVRLNAEVLKLSANDRSDFAKIRAIADRIEFDESFFNAAARPTLATYAKYEVVGVTERILPIVNAKVLELPAALRLDVKAMQDLVRVENFVDRVANPTTRSTVTSSELVSRGLLKAEYPRKHSVTQGLSRYPEGSLNTIAKIEAAIKAEIAKAEAPRLRLAEIKARMAARKK